MKYLGFFLLLSLVFYSFQTPFFREGIKNLSMVGTPSFAKHKYASGDTTFKDEIELGRTLFFDKRLSKNNNISCGSCHLPDKGLTSDMLSAKGTHGNLLTRNVPSLYNLTLNSTFFWDGRAESMEEQVEEVLTNPLEMDMDFQLIADRLMVVDWYNKEFNKVYGKKGINKKSITAALAAFEKSIVTNNSKFDRYIAGDDSAMNDMEVKGLTIFLDRGNCVQCHKGKNFTDGQFHNIGVETDDPGRQPFDKVGVKNEFEMTPYPFFATHKAFKTPSLRNVALSAPYFHNGSAETLEEVIDNYVAGGLSSDRTGIAKHIAPLSLNEKEIESLISFLHCLTDSVVIDIPIMP